ncbi:hypothetical protein EJ02DRAFT_378708 [Clathrospora elynae]|uniref:Rhodopsin domain-containing protein n=1 Tax=Clathrospora elynae TaxID=706981 RepID=A0A6A5SUY8_9PLEO|nr:hypothetical protein EJ02DRAFT_378708 [Clathrospora elynae]
MPIQLADAAVPPDENQGPNILSATLTVTSVALITVLARLYVRLRMIRNFGWDDYAMISAMSLCIAGQCIIIPEVYFGAGRHIQYIEPEHFKQAFKLNFVTQPLYLFAISLVKISVGFFLLRIAVKPFYKRLIGGIMAFMAFYTCGCFFTIVLQCTDLRVQWDRDVKGTCWTTRTLKSLSYANQGLNIITDLAFSIAIPVPMLWNVQMNKRQKVSLICILGLGVFATAAALVKLYYVSSYGRSGDWMWDSRNLTIWTVIESNVAITAGNLPCLKPLFRTVLGATYGRGSRKTGQSKYLSKPYGPGSNHRSDTKNFKSLTSDGTVGGDFQGYGAPVSAYMLTTIDAADHQGAEANRIRSGRSSPGEENSSTESITRFNDKGHGFVGRGGIAVTTKVDVIETDVYEDGKRRDRARTKEMV